MELSLSMYSMHRTVREKGWSAADWLRFCKTEGWLRVELLAHFWKDVDAELDETADTARENGIEVVSYAVSNNLVSLNPEEREAGLRKITDDIPVARRLGTNVMRVFSGNLADGIEYRDALRWIVDGLKRAADEAGQAGVTLCLENHGKLAGRGEQVKEIIDRVGSPALRSTFDTGNFLLVDERPTEAAKALLPLVGHVHFKDFQEREGGRYKSLSGRVYEGVPAGEGDADLPAVLRLLADSGYRGRLVLEYEGLGSDVEGIRRSYANFERMAAAYA
ncbi:sugar phosphate isomerase/epimerase family protein [Paenibacillus flagellatus]|uniref:Sugar phosphate isomerase/epimerase n=1 Tax=Paenibacillus flagellatus TaxID=2211139 RepID=A0A2V5KDB8_9BACL|nr:sugar phosphate isomerase/epimerase family protein [Paenibacillus flagellatus]PYI57598.1 sugar phosphate isomerase/epimerase [Paenibacillus flagellatus]